MTRAFADYTLIAGSHGPRGSLWQGPDHLLVVEGRGWPLSYQEIYRRVDYDRVQSITLVRTSSYLWLGLAWALGVLLFGLFILLARSSQSYVLVFLVLPEALLLPALIIHLAKGPTCACALQTNVQLLRLRPLHRMRRAEPAMQKLVALCRQYQGVMSPSDLGPMSTAASPPRPLEQIAGAKPPWTGTLWTSVCGVALILWGLALAGELFLPGIAFTVLDATFGALAVCVTIVALARSMRMRAPGPLLATLWSSLVVELFTAVALAVVAMGVVIRKGVVEPNQFNPKRTLSNEQMISAIADLEFSETGRWGWCVILLGAVLALLGLITLVFGSARKAAPPPAPSAPPMMPENSAP